MDAFPDLGGLSDQELKDLLRRRRRDEDKISYDRRLLQGRIDILQAELERRTGQGPEQEDTGP